MVSVSNKAVVIKSRENIKETDFLVPSRIRHHVIMSSSCPEAEEGETSVCLSQDSCNADTLMSQTVPVHT